MNIEIKKRNKLVFIDYFNRLIYDIMHDVIFPIINNKDLNKTLDYNTINNEIKTFNYQSELARNINILWECYNENIDEDVVTKIGLALFYGRFLHINCLFSLLFHTCQTYIKKLQDSDIILVKECKNKTERHKYITEKLELFIKNLISEFELKEIGCNNKCREYKYNKGEDFIKFK